MAIQDDPHESSAAGEFLARARAGDAEAFCALLEPLQIRLFRQAAALTGDLTASEDLVSEARVRAWKYLARYNESCRLSTWLYAILLHCHQEAARHARSRPLSLTKLPFAEARELERLQENESSSGLSPAAVATQNETADQVNRCIKNLPEKHREVIQLRFFEDASLQDMAAVLGCSVGTVKSRLHHALEKLRKMKMNLPDSKGNQQI